MRLKFNVSGDRIKILNSRELYSGNANYRCNFLLSSEWEGLEVFAVFTKENISYKKRIENGVCAIPFEILKGTGVFSVGIFGTNGEEKLLRISSNVIYLDVEEGAFREAEYSEEATPTIWEQYVMLCAEKASQAESARDEAQLAKEQAEAASKGIEVYAQEAKDAKEGALAAAETATKEKNEVINLKADCENAKDGAEKFKGDAEAAKRAAEGYKISAKAASAESEEYKTIAGEFAADADTHKREAEAAAERAEAAAERIDPENFVSKNGNETISGVKEFKDEVIVKEILSYDQLKIHGDGVEIITGAPVYFGSASNDANIKAATEINLDAPKVLVNNKEVATKDDIPENPKIDESNLVHKTDDEEISGNKKFTGKVDINRIDTEMGIDIYGGDAGVSFGGNADSLFMRYGAEFSLDGDLKVNGKVVAMKEDITEALENITPPAIDESNLVHKDKVETITGKKTFDNIEANTISAAKNILALVADNGVTINGKTAATTDDITIAIGDIETALDELHAYAQALVTGGGGK